MRSSKGWKLVKKRDYSQQVSLVERVEQAQTWSEAVNLCAQAQQHRHVSSKTLNKMLKVLERRRLELQQAEQQKAGRKHMQRFYAEGQLPN